MPSIITSGIMAGLATLVGGVIVLIFGRLSERTMSVFLGMAAGIMVAVVILDLIPTALHYGNLVEVLGGFSIGAVILFIIDYISSFLLFRGTSPDRQTALIKMGYLIAFGIALHDLPEGIAIAISSTATVKLGLIIALAIGLHNIPEGMAIAAPLRMGKISWPKIMVLCLLVSFVTPLGTLLGLYIAKITNNLLSFLLALASGAMIYLVTDELIPESHRRHPNYARLGMFIGFIIITIVSFQH